MAVLLTFFAFLLQCIALANGSAYPKLLTPRDNSLASNTSSGSLPSSSAQTPQPTTTGGDNDTSSADISLKALSNPAGQRSAPYKPSPPQSSDNASSSFTSQTKAGGDRITIDWANGELAIPRGITWYPQPTVRDKLVQFLIDCERTADTFWQDNRLANGTNGTDQWYNLVKDDYSFNAVFYGSTIPLGNTFNWGDMRNIAAIFWRYAHGESAEFLSISFLVKDAQGRVYADGHVGYSYEEVQYDPNRKRSIDHRVRAPVGAVQCLDKRQPASTLHLSQGILMEVNRGAARQIPRVTMAYLVTAALNQLATSGRGQFYADFATTMPADILQGMTGAAGETFAGLGFQVVATVPASPVYYLLIRVALSMLMHNFMVDWQLDRTRDSYFYGQILNGGQAIADWVVGPMVAPSWELRTIDGSSVRDVIQPDGSRTFAFIEWL
ncbi:MAG: hypothetical protein Q9222_006894 [Ikaeria aurantiellina]